MDSRFRGNDRFKALSPVFIRHVHSIRTQVCHSRMFVSGIHFDNQFWFYLFFLLKPLYSYYLQSVCHVILDSSGVAHYL